MAPWARSLAVLLAAAATRAVAGGAPVPTPGRYVVVEIDAAGRLTPIWERRVLLALPAEESGVAAAAADDVPPDAVEAAVVDGRGIVRYREVVWPAQWVRGEFAATLGGAAPIDGRFFEPVRRYVVLRVPEIADTRVTLRRRGEPALELASPVWSPGAAALEAAAARASVEVVSSTGSPANRLDLLVVGDGYTAAQTGVFDSGAQAMLSSFFAISPYAEYRPLMNVSTLFVASQQEGADHPPYRVDCQTGDVTCCSDPAAASDPLAGRTADTAFDARYCSFGVQRLLTVNEAKVLVAASAAPDWDAIVVLVNDTTYGGSGGMVAVVSTNGQSTEIAKHELGHSFTGLADEYATAYPGYPACSDVAGVPCEANVTDEVRRDLLKWSPWVLPSTPLPTPAGDPASASLLGLFEGARYLTTGMYRPRLHCLMRELGRPFCEVCRQAFALRLYSGGWGVPAGGIDPIEPGSETPPPGEVGVPAGGTVHLAVQLARPDASPSLAVHWEVDGVPIDGADGDELEWTPTAPGAWVVTLRVRDDTGLIHPGVPAPESRRDWHVSAWSPRHPRRHLLVAP